MGKLVCSANFSNIRRQIFKRLFLFERRRPVRFSVHYIVSSIYGFKGKYLEQNSGTYYHSLVMGEHLLKSKF